MNSKINCALTDSYIIDEKYIEYFDKSCKNNRVNYVYDEVRSILSEVQDVVFRFCRAPGLPLKDFSICVRIEKSEINKKSLKSLTESADLFFKEHEKGEN